MGNDLLKGLIRKKNKEGVLVWVFNCKHCGLDYEREAFQFPAYRICTPCRLKFMDIGNRSKRKETPKTGYSSISGGLRFKVLLRDNFHCVYCGRGAEDGVKLEVDHIVSKSKGGQNLIENLTTACFQCNRGKYITLINKGV